VTEAVGNRGISARPFLRSIWGFESDLVTVSEPEPYPAEVLRMAADPRVERVCFGAIPSLDYLFCIVDSSVSFWRARLETVSERGKCVSAVAEGAKNVMKLLGTGKVTEKRAHSEVCECVWFVSVSVSVCVWVGGCHSARWFSRLQQRRFDAN